LKVKIILAVLVFNFGSPVVQPIFEALVAFAVDDIWFWVDGSFSVVFLWFNDKNAFVVKINVCCFHNCWFAWYSPAEHEVVAEKVLYQVVLVGIFGICVSDERAYNFWFEDVNVVVFRDDRWFVSDIIWVDATDVQVTFDGFQVVCYSVG
jgi:hypothetical protein